VIAGHVILCVQKVLSFKMLLLEGWAGQTWKDHVHNYAPCHLPNVNGQIGSSLIVVFRGRMLCRQFLAIITMLICDQCSWGWHMGCFTPPCKKCQLINGFSFGALRFLRLDNRTNFNVFLSWWFTFGWEFERLKLSD